MPVKVDVYKSIWSSPWIFIFLRPVVGGGALGIFGKFLSVRPKERRCAFCMVLLPVLLLGFSAFLYMADVALGRTVRSNLSIR